MCFLKSDNDVSKKEWTLAKKIEKNFSVYNTEYKEKKNVVNDEQWFRNKYDHIKQQDKAKKLGLIGLSIYIKMKIIPYKVQYVAANSLITGKIIEMRTGEGKSLVSLIASTYLALEKRKVYNITVNDYLAKRDYLLNQGVFSVFNIKSSFLSGNDSYSEKKDIYHSQVIYSNNSTVAFDYLRSLLAHRDESVVVDETLLDVALIDEADSILLDDAQTPLLISDSKVSKIEADPLILADLIAKNFSKKDMYIDLQRKSVKLSEHGLSFLNSFFNKKINQNFRWRLRQALIANYLYRGGTDYLVRNGKVVLIDKNTGRLSSDRRLTAGLHQALEAKEGVEILQDSDTSISITYKNFFQLFNMYSGMTGTAYSDRKQLHDFYQKKVERIPTNFPNLVKYLPNRYFVTRKGKYNALIDEVIKAKNHNQPVLVGSTTEFEANKIHQLLVNKNIEHDFLSAVNVEKEASIIKKAGHPGHITIATTMAGRGTDIKITDYVRKLGGLKVIVSTRSGSMRVDQQFAGRTGRQGDPGSVQFYMSLEDKLLAVYLSNHLLKKINVAKWQQNDGELQPRTLNKLVHMAQLRTQAQIYGATQESIKFDLINYQQMQSFFKSRNKVLHDANNVDSDFELKVYDQLWLNHIKNLKLLKQEAMFINLGQRTPITWYAENANQRWKELMQNIEEKLKEKDIDGTNGEK